MAHILVVDDEAGMRTFAERALTRAGHRVTLAENGRRALEAVSRSAFDVIVTDLLMPEMEGIEFLLELRRRAMKIPIIAMSGGGRMDALTYFGMARHAGAARFLAKPFSLEDLLAAVGEVTSPGTAGAPAPPVHVDPGVTGAASQSPGASGDTPAAGPRTP